jgi:hypothetical protein
LGKYIFGYPKALVRSELPDGRVFFAERTWRVACTFFKELVEMKML